MSRIEQKWPNSKLAQRQTEKPEITKRLRNQSIREGGTILLESEAQLFGGRGSFYKNGEIVTENPRTQILQIDSKFQLRIEPALSHDYGEYTFEAQNSVGSVHSKCLVNIERRSSSAKPGSKPIFEEIMEDCQIPIGGNAAFQVQVKSFPAAQVCWKLNNKEVTNFDKGAGLLCFYTRSSYLSELDVALES